MSFCSSKVCKSQVLRTGASLFFNLDVTHWRSAEAKEGLHDAVPAQCKLETFSTHGNRKGILNRIGLTCSQKDLCLGVSVGMIRIFTIFCVWPLVSIYRFRRSLTSISFI